VGAGNPVTTTTTTIIIIITAAAISTVPTSSVNLNSRGR
jgi:hypothetical protein